MHGARGVPAADENEQADEQIEQAHDAQVILGCQRLFCRRREQRGFEFLAAARKFVAHLGPQPRTVETPRHFRRSTDRSTIDREKNVARANSSAGGRRIRSNPAGLNSMVGIEPGHAVVHHLEAAALVEVDQGKNHRSECGQRQHDRPKADSKILPHSSIGQGYTLPQETKCNPKSIVWKMRIRETLLYSTAYHGGRLDRPASSCFWKDKYSFREPRNS